MPVDAWEVLCSTKLNKHLLAFEVGVHSSNVPRIASLVCERFKAIVDQAIVDL